jgi:ElaB/YqjD/DUF883 family membrane-anchored ribosome-binding protein
MTEMTQAPPTEGERGMAQQAKEKVQEATGQVQQQAGEKAQELRGQATDAITQQLDTRSTQAGEQVTATADAIRRVSEMLRDEGNTAPAKYADRVAEPAERLGRYLTETDGNKILSDAEQFARRRPWLAVVGGATIGFVVARFIKASGTQQPQSGGTQPALPESSTQIGGVDGQSAH